MPSLGRMNFLLIRLSSMGDVVLTTPLIRALHERFPEAKLHFLTKRPYMPILAHHPLLYAVHAWGEHVGLYHERWTGVIDLQKNLRTLPLRWRLRYERFTTFPKENRKKWLMVRWKRAIPIRHVVERYGEALRPWGITSEALGPLEIHIPPEVESKVQAELAHKLPSVPWIAVGLGGTYQTKRWLPEYFQTLLSRLELPVILLGGKAEEIEARFIAEGLPVPVVLGAGRYSVLETAAAIKAASVLLSHDTGTAHLGAAVGTPTVVLWGNTIPAFGMTPWRVPYLGIEAEHLACRPCSKLGFDRCPKQHHDCMRALTPDYVEKRVRAFLYMLGLV